MSPVVGGSLYHQYFGTGFDLGFNPSKLRSLVDITERDNAGPTFVFQGQTDDQWYWLMVKSPAEPDYNPDYPFDVWRATVFEDGIPTEPDTEAGSVYGGDCPEFLYQL